MTQAGRRAPTRVRGGAPRGPYELTSVGLRLGTARPSLEEWGALGTYLAVAERSIQWWIGDWLRLGEEAYGEAVWQWVDATGWDPDTVLQYRWVAERVPYENRRADLTFSHHREVADLPPAEQVRWLARAATGAVRWSVDRLRRELNAAKTGTAPTVWVTVEAKDDADARALVDRMLAEGRRVKVR